MPPTYLSSRVSSELYDIVMALLVFLQVWRIAQVVICDAMSRKFGAGPFPIVVWGRFVVPFKANAERRHHIPKQRHRVTNSAAYDAALRQRGSLTVWFTDAAIAAWKAEARTTRGGQSRYSALAIATALTLRAVFRLALRQTEGLISSIIALLGP